MSQSQVSLRRRSQQRRDFDPPANAFDMENVGRLISQGPRSTESRKKSCKVVEHLGTGDKRPMSKSPTKDMQFKSLSFLNPDEVFYLKLLYPMKGTSLHPCSGCQVQYLSFDPPRCGCP